VAVGILEFGDFKLDRDRFELSRAGRSLKLERKPMELLILLASRRGQLVARSEISERLWGTEVYVDTEHGINTAVRKIRQVLGDDPESPRFVETVTGKGYRFSAPVSVVDPVVDSVVGEPPESVLATPAAAPRNRFGWYIVAAICVLLVIVGAAMYPPRLEPPEIKFTQLTDFSDSAVSPVLSPDGRMMAFVRGGSSFMSVDQIYVKMLPNGEARRVTDDSRVKYGLAFSPDGSEIAYTVMDPPGFSTYSVSVLGGDPHLLLKNAAGLSWLDPHQLLYSQIRSGLHLGVVTGSVEGGSVREIYFPSHERAMAHYSYPSTDHRWVLVVEMDENGEWASCKLVSLDGQPPIRSVGPSGGCTSAGWSPDGSWMYFAATVEGHSHLWRQRFPNGAPEQITFGPTEEKGLAVERTGRSLITSIGAGESDIWIHDENGERPLSSEGEVVSRLSPPSFSHDDKILYYLLRHRPEEPGTELWSMTLESGESEAVFPGIYMLAYDVSPDGKQVVYSTATADGKTQLWLAPVDRSSPAIKVGEPGGMTPHFGARGQILFQLTEGNANYLEQMNPDGSGRSKVVPYPIIEILGTSPGRRWVMAVVPTAPGSKGPAVVAIPADGGPPRLLCSFCVPAWSPSGDFLFLSVEMASRTSPGRSLAIPVGPGEELPNFPPEGLEPMADASVVPGAHSVPRAILVPGRDPAHFVYVNTVVHRNLYRISLP
jgi:DNA-binding winged helix-turn-helix (wHTH) protein/Tol biopolymer transport system component